MGSPKCMDTENFKSAYPRHVKLQGRYFNTNKQTHTHTHTHTHTNTLVQIPQPASLNNFM